MDLPTMLPEIISVVLGALAPVIIKWINTNVGTEIIRFMIAVALSAVTGVLAALITGQSLALTPVCIAIVFTFSQLAWNLFWKPIVFVPSGYPGPNWPHVYRQKESL